MSATNNKSVLIHTGLDEEGNWESELWQKGQEENKNFIYRWGFCLVKCHLKTGKKWFSLQDKKDGEIHSGDAHGLYKVFTGEITLEDFYGFSLK